MPNALKAVVVAASLIMLPCLGCSSGSQGNSTGVTDLSRVTFVSNYAPIEFSFPQGWYVNTEENPYDLQCFSQAQDMNTGVFVYRKLDIIAADSTPLDTYWDVINDLGTKRTNFKEIEELQKNEADDKTVTTVTYSGERDSELYYYRFSLIEFREDDSKFAVVLQVALPEEWTKSKPVLDAITLSAKSISEVPEGNDAGDATGESPQNPAGSNAAP